MEQLSSKAGETRFNRGPSGCQVGGTGHTHLETMNKTKKQRKQTYNGVPVGAQIKSHEGRCLKFQELIGHQGAASPWAPDIAYSKAAGGRD